MSREIYARTAQKHDTAVNWGKAMNFIPVKGEIIVYDPDDDYAYSRFKIGDGITVANELPFAAISPEELATFEQGVAEFLYEIYGDDIPQDGEPTPTVREIANSEAAKVKNELLNGAGGAYDTLKELGDLIDDNQDAIEALEQVATNKADKVHTHAKSEVGLSNVDNVKQYSASNPPPYPVTSVNGKTGAVTLGAADVGARPSTWTPSYSDVGADKSGAATAAVSAHNTATNAHADIRAAIPVIQMVTWESDD